MIFILTNRSNTHFSLAIGFVLYYLFFFESNNASWITKIVKLLHSFNAFQTHYWIYNFVTSAIAFWTIVTQKAILNSEISLFETHEYMSKINRVNINTLGFIVLFVAFTIICNITFLWKLRYKILKHDDMNFCGKLNILFDDINQLIYLYNSNFNINHFQYWKLFGFFMNTSNLYPDIMIKSFSINVDLIIIYWFVYVYFADIFLN